MTLNSNFLSIPVLKLSQHPIQVKGDGISLFEKFTNPKNSVNLSLKERGTVTAVFKKGLELSKLELSGLYPGELPCRRTFLGEFMDPQSKLKSLINEGKITRIHGNCPVDQAQVVLLDDTNHLDKEQPIIRGEIANSLKSDTNIYLCEGHPPNKIDFTQREINHRFAPNLELNQKGSKDYLSGWDDSYLHKQSNEALVRGLQQINLSNLSSPSSLNLNMLLHGIKDLQSVTGKMCKLRTEALCNTIQEKHKIFPNAKIIVFGGERHLQDKSSLHEQLINQNLRFVEISSIDVMSDLDKLSKVQGHYEVGKYSIWGNRKE